MICISCAMDWCVCGQLQSCYLWERRPDWPWLLASPDALWWRSVKFPRRPDDLCSSITSFSGIHSWTAVSQDQRKICVRKHAWYQNAVFLVLPAYIQNWWIVYHIIFTSHYVMFNHLLKQISVHSKKKEQISVDQLLINQLSAGWKGHDASTDVLGKTENMWDEQTFWKKGKHKQTEAEANQESVRRRHQLTSGSMYRWRNHTDAARPACIVCIL